MSFLNWFCIIYTVITLICFVWTMIAIKKAPSVDPKELFLRGDMKPKDLIKENKED